VLVGLIGHHHWRQDRRDQPHGDEHRRKRPHCTAPAETEGDEGGDHDGDVNQ